MPRLAVLVLLAAAAPAFGQTTPVTFKNDVAAVLIRGGCNSGPCHGNLTGKGGLKLSLRGEDPANDFAILTRDMLARRTDPASPDESLMLKKAAGRVGHEGGTRFGTDSREYAVVRNWIAAGCPPDASDTPTATKLVVTPADAVLYHPADRVTLAATAHYSDGSSRIVTRLVAFDTNNLGVAKVLPSGEVVRENDGEVVVLVRYLGLQVPVRIAFVPARPAPDLSPLAGNHPIDARVAAQLNELRIPASPACSDEVFVRRAYLDAVGMIPPPEAVRAFLADASPGKRNALIDALLARPEFAEFWAMKWSDLLRNEEKSLDKKGVQGFHRWLKASFAADRPLTDLARDVLSARGSTYANPAANFYRAVRDPYERAEAVAQVFLGVRVGCARCHNHPFDRWTTDEYHRFAAFFPRVQYRVLENKKRDDLDKHEFVGEQVVYADRTGEIPHPKTRVPAVPKFLGADTPDIPADADRLGLLADWVTGPANPHFARAQANRVWFHLFGRGLVDPNDDFRATNPAVNPGLLDDLAAAFRAGNFRVRPFVKFVMTSKTYQLSSSPVPGNEADDTHLSHALVQPLKAEQLLDGVSQALGGTVKFPGYPRGTRAGALPAATGDRGRRPEGERFMKVFGKPDRLLTCECERSEDAGLMQSLQLLTGKLVNDQLRAADNRIGTLAAAGASPAAALDELYLAALARFPTPAERAVLLPLVAAAADPRAAWEDVAWGLVNSKEFLLRR